MKQREIGASPRGLPSRFAAQGLGALLVLSAGHLFVDAYSSAYAPMLAILRERIGLSYAQVGAGAALFSFSASVMQPIYGLISDRLASTIVIVAAPAIAAVGLASMPAVGTFPAVLGSLFVAGIGVAAFHPQGASQAADTLIHRPSLAMALFIGAGNVGFALGPAMITIAYATWGWDGLWRVAIPGVLATLLLAPTAPAPERRDQRHRQSVAAVLRQRWQPLLTMYLFVVVRGTVQIIFVSFVPLYLLDAGMSSVRAGAALSLFLAAGSLGSVVGGVLGDRVGERTVIRWSMAGALPFYLVAVLMPTPGTRLLAWSAAFFILLWSNPLTVVLAQSWVPEHRSTVSALLMGFAWGVGGVLAPLFGVAADVTGLGPALGVLGGLPVVGAALAWWLPGRSLGEQA